MDEALAQVDRLIDIAFSTMEGWCSTEKARAMARFVARAPALVDPLCVELGVFGGRGTLAMGLAVKHALGSRGKVHGIDPYTVDASLEGKNDKANDDWWAKVDYTRIRESALSAFKTFYLSQIIELKVKRSQDVVGDYADKSIFVLHQDSNHSEEISCREVEMWAPKMMPGGYWIFDDANWPSTQKAQAMLTGLGFDRIEDHLEWVVFRAPNEIGN